MEALVIANRLSALKSMVLMHKPELMKTEAGREALKRMSAYLEQTQKVLSSGVSHGK
jgi:Lon protease-like protein